MGSGLALPGRREEGAQFQGGNTEELNIGKEPMLLEPPTPEINPCTYGQLIHDRGGKTVSSINSAGKTGQLHVKKMKLEHSLTPYTKINSKWIHPL